MLGRACLARLAWQSLLGKACLAELAWQSLPGKASLAIGLALGLQVVQLFCGCRTIPSVDGRKRWDVRWYSSAVTEQLYNLQTQCQTNCQASLAKQALPSKLCQASSAKQALPSKLCPTSLAKQALLSKPMPKRRPAETPRNLKKMVSAAPG